MDKMPQKRVPLNVRSIWKRDHQLGTIEKIIFTSEPGADVPAYVCIPKNAEPPYTFMICLQGHNSGMNNSIGVDRKDQTKSIKIAGDRDFAIGCMKRGVAALCIEQRSLGERRELKKQRLKSKCGDAFLCALMLGRNLIGERVYDVDRAIDYLKSRDDVNMNRIGVMGHSGGGTVAIYAGAILPRISFIMPSGSFCTYKDSWLSIVHCCCGYIPGLYEVAEYADLTGLLAPRPVVIVAGKGDHIQPIKGVREAFQNLKQIYRAAGAEDRCHLVVGSEGHRFYADQAWSVLEKELDRLAQ